MGRVPGRTSKLDYVLDSRHSNRVRSDRRFAGRANVRLLAQSGEPRRALRIEQNESPQGCARRGLSVRGALGGRDATRGPNANAGNASAFPNFRGTLSRRSPGRASGPVSEFPSRRSGRSRLRFDQRKSPGPVSRAAVSSPGRQQPCRCSVSRSA
jgi:hypothetical protein